MLSGSGCNSQVLEGGFWHTSLRVEFSPTRRVVPKEVRLDLNQTACGPWVGLSRVQMRGYRFVRVVGGY